MDPMAPPPCNAGPPGPAGGALAAGWAERAFWHRPEPPPGHRGLEPTWRDLAWMSVVGHADTLLRRCYGVFEFTDHPECVLRLEACRAQADLQLSDGTRVAAGEPLGGLHFWNEHVPPFPAAGPDLRWAKAMQHCMGVSMGELARFVAQAPEWRDVKVFGGGAPFCGRLCSMRIRRVSARYGFELVEHAGDHASRQGLGHNIMLWALARAFNPVASRRHSFARQRHELWISRDRLMRGFGPGAARPAA